MRKLPYTVIGTNRIVKDAPKKGKVKVSLIKKIVKKLKKK